MALMNQIQRGKSSAPRRVMLFGTHGVGKSTFGASAPQPIFIPTEDGLGQIDVDHFPLATSFQAVLQAMGELYSEPHDFRTVIVDSLDWLERLIWTEVCRKHGVENIEDIGYAKGYMFALTPWREFLGGLDALRNVRQMAVILIAHAKIEKFEHPETDPFDRFVPRLHKLVSHIIQEWADEVLFSTFKVFTRQTDEGFGRKKARGLGTGERVIRTTERPAHVAKNRLNLPDEIPLSYDEFAKYLPIDQQPNQELIHA